MKTTIKSITVREGGELAQLLDETADELILIAGNGDHFRLRRETTPELLPPTDPDLVNQILDETAGSWSDIDTDQFIADLYDARILGSRPHANSN